MASQRYEPRGFPRPALDSGQWLLVTFVGLLVIWSVAQTAVSGVHDVHAALAFGALIAFGELLRLNLPGDREAAPIATAGAMAYALLLRIGNAPARPEAAQVIAVTRAGLIGDRWWTVLPVMLGLVVAAWLLESAVGSQRPESQPAPKARR